MNWKFSSAAIFTSLLFTFNAHATLAQNKPTPTIASSLPAAPDLASAKSAAKMVPAGHATIVVRVLDASGVPLKQQAVVQLLADGAPDPIGSATTAERPALAKFDAAQSHLYTVRASAAGYETAELHLQTYPRDTYYQAVLRLQPKPVAKPESGVAPLGPKAAEEAEKGLVEFEAGKFSDASKDFEKACRLAPQNPDLNFLLGVSLFESHQLGRAQEYLQRATSLDPQHVPSLVALGRVHLQQREFNNAAIPLKKAISINPKSWGAHLLLSSVYLVRREFVAAVEQSREAIRLGQGAANSGGLVLGEALAAQGQRDEAREALTVFLHAAPGSPAAPAAEKLLRQLQHNDPLANAELVDAALVSAKAVPIANAEVAGIPWHSWRPESVDQEKLSTAAGMVCPAQSVLDNATQRVDDFVADVNRFDAVERVINENLNSSGRVVSSEHRKFDYVVSISQLRPGSLDVDESRNGTDGLEDFPDHIATIGLPSLALIFHQDYRSDYVFNCEGLGEWNGRATWLVHFRQRADRVPRIRGYNIDGVLYPVALTGRAWITADSFQIVHMEADLMSPAPKIKLAYEHQAIDYGPVAFQDGRTQLWLPQRASLYFDFEHHRYHRVHSFSNYLLFSVKATEKISPPNQVAMQSQNNANKTTDK